MPRILVTRFPTKSGAADASQLGFGTTGYGSLLHDAGFNPVICDYMGALEALEHGGPFQATLVELEGQAPADAIERYAKYLRIFRERMQDAGAHHPLVPILSHDGLIVDDVRHSVRDHCTYAFLKPLATKERFAKDLATLITAKKPHLRVTNAPPTLERHLCERLKLAAPLKPNTPYDAGTFTVRKELYLGIYTREESLQFTPTGKLADAAIDVLLHKLSTEYQDRAHRRTVTPVDIELRA